MKIKELEIEKYIILKYLSFQFFFENENIVILKEKLYYCYVIESKGNSNYIFFVIIRKKNCHATT